MSELTGEIRWWGKGEAPEDVVGWYEAGPVEPGGGAEARTDRYIPTDSAEIGFKYRGCDSLIEAKSFVERFTVGGLPAGTWIKQRLDLSRNGATVAIAKDRRMRLFDCTADALREVPLGPDETPLNGERPALGCGVELARVTRDDVVWWSVCFEAYGGLEHSETALARTLNHLAPLPSKLIEARIASYPEWLLGFR